MKRFLCMLCILLLTCLVCGCDGGGDASSSAPSSGGSDTSSQEAPYIPEDVYPLADDSYEQRDGIPPLNDALKQLFKDSFTLYNALFNGDGEPVSIDGESGYYKIGDYADTDALEVAFLKCFSQDFYDAQLKSYVDGCKSHDGALYVKPEEAGVNSGYIGHRFLIGDLFDDQITFTSIVYLDYNNSVNHMNYMPNGGMGEYQTRNGTYKLEKGDEGWRFTAFDLLY